MPNAMTWIPGRVAISAPLRFVMVSFTNAIVSFRRRRDGIASAGSNATVMRPACTAAMTMLSVAAVR